MLFGKVTGTVVASHKDEKLVGQKFLLVQVVDVNGRMSQQYVVASDAVGAGVNEVVMFVSGSSARQTTLTKDKPVDATIMAIVDTWDVDGKVIFQKDETEIVPA